MGHTVAAHISTTLFSALNRHWGLERKEAALRGALTTFAYLSVVEFGDGFTREHGFTYGDVVANAAGCLFGYFHETSPWFARTFDLRWEYWPTDRVWSGENLDLVTDYEGSSYVLATNVGALVSRRPTVWDLLDLQVGYYCRHYEDGRGDPERRGLGRAFEYYQVPGISLRLSTDLND